MKDSNNPVDGNWLLIKRPMKCLPTFAFVMISVLLTTEASSSGSSPFSAPKIRWPVATPQSINSDGNNQKSNSPPGFRIRRPFNIMPQEMGLVKVSATTRSSPSPPLMSPFLHVFQKANSALPPTFAANRLDNTTPIRGGPISTIVSTLLSLPIPSIQFVLVGGFVAATTTSILRRKNYKNRSPSLSNAGQQIESLRRALYFWIHAGPILCHYKFKSWWLHSKYRKASLAERDVEFSKLHAKHAEPILQIILHLQGLFVKAGQVLSSRPDFCPPEFVEHFVCLQDSLPPWPVDHAKELVKSSLLETSRNRNRKLRRHDERGHNHNDYLFTDLEWDDVFESFDEEPLGSASIGQVYRAVLRNNGEWDRDCSNSSINNSNPNSATPQVVAIKVMHPYAERRFACDFQIFRWVCRIFLPGWKPILKEVEKQMMTEFDYEREAQSMEDVRRNMECSKYAKRVLVPEPIMELCSKNLLVMEMLEGKKLADSIEDKLAAALGGDKQLVRDFLQAKRDELMAGDDKEEVAHEGVEDIEVHNLASRGGGAVSTKKSRQVVSSSPVSNSGPLPTKKRPSPPNLSIMGLIRKPRMAISLLNLFRQTRGYIDLLLDVSGYQIFIDGCFNGDPHPGNVMELNDGRLGLLDYGQCRRLEEYERIALAQIVALLGKRDNTENNEDDKSSLHEKDIADAMRKCGFRSKYNRDDMLVKYAELFFDSDIAGKKMGFESPHLYFRHLMKLDKLQNVPDCAVFVARSSFLFRGMGAMLENQICTAKRWASHAEAALENNRK
eukprot:CAMPEP_0195309038 /NCGR_PEP_ID=MMETSP0707-20130614/38535_1 /TAXON_ID=33640 /ORGANISM="Asterionellopsis glacialis, Strain CCMP134" /LENGTH=781 /DNA_ID=CAMNT_0040373333 /DNA_START=574 /DNA_END=2919 /DNA_ORIENTATION=-